MNQPRLSPLALGLALGVMWGVSVFLMGLIAYQFMYGATFVSTMGTLYVGYEATIIGSIIGGLIGFVDAFIGGAVIAWLYNVFSACCHKKK